MAKINNAYYDMMIGLFAEMITDHALYKRREQQLLGLIEESLIDKNKDEFINLTNELSELKKDMCF
jgi:uncharacterized protein YpiB (UPF0302 family)